MDTLQTLLSEQSFMPHGHCYLWSTPLVWVQFTTNMLIGLSYVAISTVLTLFVRRGRDLPFRWVYVCFGLFIIACGLTHFMDALVIWQPRYWLDGALRIVTAIASVGTALMLPSSLPGATELVKGVRATRERGVALEAAVVDLETMYKKSLELDHLKTSFFANVSHELRTPLALVLGPVEQLLQSDRLDSEQRRELELVARNARFLLGHVNNLLDIAKLDAGKLEPRFAAVDLSELVRFTVANFDSLAREREIDLAVHVPAVLRAEVDTEKVQRVLLNLLSNAFKFTPTGGKIRLDLLAPTGPADPYRSPSGHIVVADSGPGVEEADREHIFERFHQADQATARVGGTGLGLSIVREFVTLHGGNVSITDAPEGGALFDIELPLRAPAGARVHRDVQLSEVAVKAAVQQLRGSSTYEDEAQSDDVDRPIVLVVDDNDDMRTLLVRTLRGRYRIAQARDGVEALAKAQKLMPDLIVSDLMMPKMSGEELVVAMRKVPELAAVPILLLTAKSDEGMPARTIELGAQDYVLKPFSTDELLARVQNLLMIKRTRDLLQNEVEAQQEDVEGLSRLVVAQKRELSAALHSAREAKTHAEQASRAKSDFLSLVSHELRTPLTSIQLQLERLRRGIAGTITPEQIQAMEKIGRSSARLLDLLDSLLEFGRIESGRLEVTISSVDLLQVAREVIDELKPRAEQKGISLTLSGAEEPLVVQTDARLVRLIVINLVDNAVKYTEHGAIDVRVEATPEHGARMSVVDTGPGIDPALQDIIFEPFQQLEQVRHKRGSGVGLGLALVSSIARALHADVSLDSALGRGSAFTVTLSAA
jgi:signal transduction histidine kinase